MREGREAHLEDQLEIKLGWRLLSKSLKVGLITSRTGLLTQVEVSMYAVARMVF